MKSWLKFFFGSFFSDKLSAEAAKRNLWNSLLSVTLMTLILCTGYFTAFTVSFGYHYNKSAEYSGFVSSAFDGITLNMDNGILTASETVNDFEGLGAEEKLKGYGLILDTFPAATDFAEFIVPCIDSKGNEITYEEYLELSDEEKKGYELKLQNSGKRLDVSLKQNEYKSFLNESDGGKKALKELDEKLSKGEISDKDYADKVYIEFVKRYYPSMSQVERYGEAPTLRTYYLGMAASGFSDKYLMVLDDLLVGSFVTDSGVTVNFEGYYQGIPDGEITDINLLIKKAFSGSGKYNFLMCFFNMFRLIPVFLIVFLILAVVVFIVLRYKLPTSATGYLGAFKIVCSYILFSSVIAFAVALIASLLCAKNTVYLVGSVAFCVIVALRAGVFLVRYRLALRKASEAENPDKTPVN